MSVDRINISNGALERARQSYGVGETRSAEQPKQTSVADDQVSLSDAAKNADRLSNLAQQTRFERIEAVRQSIADGTYYVTGEEIAKKLIELNTR